MGTGWEILFLKAHFDFVDRGSIHLFVVLLLAFLAWILHHQE